MGRPVFDQAILRRATASRTKMWVVRLLGERHTFLDGEHRTVWYSFRGKLYLDKMERLAALQPHQRDEEMK